MLAGHIQEYGAYVKPVNIEYRTLLIEMEKSLELLLNGQFELNDEDAERGLLNFINGIDILNESAADGREGFLTLVKVMDDLPKIEKNFNRSKGFMIAELNEFIGNIDLNIAVMDRTQRLGNSLIKKSHNKKLNPTK